MTTYNVWFAHRKKPVRVETVGGKDSAVNKALEHLKSKGDFTHHSSDGVQYRVTKLK